MCLLKALKISHKIVGKVTNLSNVFVDRAGDHAPHIPECIFVLRARSGSVNELQCHLAEV